MNSKTLTRSLIAMVAAATLCVTGAEAALQKKPPGAFDFSMLTASGSERAQFVEVKLTTPLLQMASRLAADKEPELARLLSNLKSVHVNVVSLGEDNRAEVSDQVSKLRGLLGATGWEQVARVKDGGADIAVHFKTRGAEAVEGVVVSIYDGDKEAVMVNVVGDVKPEELARLGAKLKIDPLQRAGEVIQGNDAVKSREK